MASSSRAPIPRQAKAHASYYEPPVWTPGRSLKGSLGYAADNLNLQSYSRSASQWAWGMALRVFHSTKRGKHRRWAAVQPQMVGSDLHLFELTATCVKEVASRCRPLIQRSSSDEPMTLELRGERCLSIMMEYEGFRKAGVGRTDALLHYTLRLLIASEPDGYIEVTKVQYGAGGSVSYGIRARKPIGAGCILEAACSSMQDNLAEVSGASIIQSGRSQLGPVGNRGVDGVFSLINHCCKPNCQIVRIPDTHAVTVQSLRDIEKGEELTVKYCETGYYQDGCLCFACTQHDPTRLIRPFLKPPSGDHGLGTVKSNKRGHRGGRAGKADAAARHGLRQVDGAEK